MSAELTRQSDEGKGAHRKLAEIVPPSYRRDTAVPKSKKTAGNARGKGLMTKKKETDESTSRPQGRGGSKRHSILMVR
jgi:hypothetical protein